MYWLAPRHGQRGTHQYGLDHRELSSHALPTLHLTDLSIGR